MAFMFESCLMVGVTVWGLKHCEKIQPEYNQESWEPLVSHFEEPTENDRQENDVARIETKT